MTRYIFLSINLTQPERCSLSLSALKHLNATLTDKVLSALQRVELTKNDLICVHGLAIYTQREYIYKTLRLLSPLRLMFQKIWKIIYF